MNPLSTRADLYPLLPLSTAFAVGILIERFAAVPIILLAVVAALSMLAAVGLRDKNYAAWFLVCAFCSIGAVSLYLEAKSISEDRVRTLIDTAQIASSSNVEVTGRLVIPPEYINDGVLLTVDVGQINLSEQVLRAEGQIRIYTILASEESVSDFRELDLGYGSIISAAGEISREEKFENPGVQSRVELLDRAGIDANLYVKSPLLIEHVDDSSVFLPLRWAYEARAYLIEQFHTRFSRSTAGVLSASMLGEKHFLDKTTADVFREGGTFHVLVISGLHITFIGGLLLVFVSTITRSRWQRFLIVSTVLWGYAFAVGAEPPVTRASLMFTIALLGYALGREANLLNSLGACVLILLTWRPSSLFDPSLQLTIVSVAGITMCAFPLIEKIRSIGSWMPTANKPFPPKVPAWLRRLCETLYWNPAAWSVESSRQIWSARIQKSPYLARLAERSARRLIAYVFEGLLISIVLQIWLLPISIIYFHRVTPISLVMNLWVGVVLALESFCALVAVALSTISSFFAEPLFTLTEFFNALLINVPAWFTRYEFASWRMPHYSGYGAIVYIFYFVSAAIITILIWRWDPFALTCERDRIHVAGKRVKLLTLTTVASAVIALLLVVVVLHPFSSPRPDGRLHVNFLDVDQGDSALVTFPDGTTMLIDGGGRMEFQDKDDSDESYRPDTPGIGEAIVSPYLWHEGYSSIDYMVATHADADHIQGLAEVAENFDIGLALVGRQPADDPEYIQFSDALARRSIPVKTVSRGRTLKIGGAAVEFLYPLTETSENTVSDNNSSVVIRIVYGGRAFLFAGDIESAAEGELLSGGGTLEADVMKVPHHGSRTSSTRAFVDAVKAGLAVASAGRHSRFGHPHREVTERWASAGARVLITAQNGMISVSTDGRDLIVDTFSKNGAE